MVLRRFKLRIFPYFVINLIALSGVQVNRRPSVFGGGGGISHSDSNSSLSKPDQVKVTVSQDGKPRRKISASSMDSPAFTIDENPSGKAQGMHAARAWRALFFLKTFVSLKICRFKGGEAIQQNQCFLQNF